MNALRANNLVCYPIRSISNSSCILSKKKVSPSSTRWLKRQSKDKYAKMAKKDGAPSRATYKLEQIDEYFQKKTKTKFGLFLPGQTIIDLGVRIEKINTHYFLFFPHLEKQTLILFLIVIFIS